MNATATASTSENRNSILICYNQMRTLNFLELNNIIMKPLYTVQFYNEFENGIEPVILLSKPAIQTRLRKAND